MDLSTVYDEPFFEMHAPWQLEYNAIADLLASWLQFSSVLIWAVATVSSSHGCANWEKRCAELTGLPRR